jgi:hypothetical protein
MFDLCSKICTALKPQCGINFVRKIFRILEKFLKYNLWKHKNNSIEQYIRETNRNNKQLTSKKYAAQTSDFGCNEQQLTSILTQSDRSNRKCLILEIRLRVTVRGFESHPVRHLDPESCCFRGLAVICCTHYNPDPVTVQECGDVFRICGRSR